MKYTKEETIAIVKWIIEDNLAEMVIERSGDTGFREDVIDDLSRLQASGHIRSFDVKCGPEVDSSSEETYGSEIGVLIGEDDEEWYKFVTNVPLEENKETANA